MSQRLAFLLAAVVALALAAPGHVQACGGFFCNSTPVDQTGEQIVFSIDGKGVTATIRIQYTGAAKDFAWVVPVMSKPEIRIGSTLLFSTLRNATQPTWALDLGALANCGGGGRGFGNAGGPAPASAPGAGGTTGGVNVLEMKEVGPYESVILESHDTAELITWLTTNGYDQPASSTPLIDHYVKQQMLFVGLKLKQDAVVGEIQPVELAMPHGEACVPLVLTAVAATPNMPVQIFVLGSTQAAPRNWFHVEVNQRRLDWLNGAFNYQQLLTQAIDEAAGHGFVTEYAGPTPAFKGVLYKPETLDLEGIRTATDPVALVDAINRSGLTYDATLLALLRKYIPKPSSLTGVPDAQFYRNLSLYRSSLGNLQVSGAAFLKELDDRVLGPLRRGQEMIDRQPYLTRLYSTVSPDEMNRDPFFHFNGELPAVSNAHRARAISGTCLADGRISRLVAQIDNGQRVDLTDASGNPLNGMPLIAGQAAAQRVSLVGASGPSSYYSRGQVREVDQALNTSSAELVRTMFPGSPASNEGGGCAFGGAERPLASVLALAALAALGIVIRRRRS